MTEDDAIKAAVDKMLAEHPEAKGLFDEVMKEAFGIQRTLRGLARDHLREKGGWIEINGQRFYPGDIPEEH